MRVARIVWCVLALVAGLFTSAPQMQAEEVSKTLKARLFARYDKKNLIVTHDKLRVTLLNGRGWNGIDYFLHYDHFYPGIPKNLWPKDYQKRNLVDEYTTEQLAEGAFFADAMAVGEMVAVKLFYVKRRDLLITIDMYMVALDSKRVARTQATYADGGQGLMHSQDFGFNMRFIIPMPTPTATDDGYVGEVTKMIDQYLVPTDEYFEKNKVASAAKEAQKNVEIKPGMTKAEVFSALGEPQKSITFGDKIYLKYADFTVELVSDKVTDVKTN